MKRLLDNTPLLMILLAGFTLGMSLQMCCVSNASVEKTILPESYGNSFFKSGIVIWKDLPITISMSESAKIFYGTAIYEGAKSWNNMLGCEVFIIVNHFDATIPMNIYFGPPKGTNWIASQRYQKFRNKIISPIEYYLVNIPNSNYFKEQVVIHELGHALGIKHSKHPSSIMYSEATGYGKYIEKVIVDDIKNIYCSERNL